MKYTVFLLLFLLIIISFLYFFKNVEPMINYQAPHMSSATDIKTIGELMRIGSQGQENSKYDQIDTTYLTQKT